jgi:polyisoprenyl-teichoic acid--peptidoglycan teichoic acid transferase
MAPAKKGGGNGGGGKKPRADETSEYELGDDFLADIDDENEDPEDLEDEEFDDEDLEDEDFDDEDFDDEDEEDFEEDDLEDEELDEEDLEDEDLEDEDLDEEELPEEDELEEIVSAETQEWDGLDAAEDDAAEEKTLVATAGARVKDARSAVTSGFDKVRGTSGFQAIKRWRPGFPLWLRFLTASLLIVVSIAGATSASLILYLSDIANALKHGSILNGVQPFLKVPGSGPQTILIIGSDRRNQALSGKYGLSDTTMLLRLDPTKIAIAQLSLPRDLKVDIPGAGTDKLNAAYSLGGPKLTLQVVKSLTGLEINHLVNVDFTGFARAVNAIGCVYVDVDHRYFHQNGPTPSASDYAEINLQPGYQALCGFDALSFARYRHTDNDIVRAARQQAFLREARAKVPPTRLFEDRSKLIKIFTSYTSSDITSAEQMLQVLKLFFDERSAPVKEIHFNGTVGPSFVTATPEEVQTAVHQFLGIEGTPGPPGSSAQPAQKVAPEAAPDATKPTPAAGSKKKGGSATPAPSGTLTRTTYGLPLARAIRARGAKVPIFYPTLLEVGSDYAQKPRVYKINGKGDEAPPAAERAAYKWVFSLPTIGDYYGFEGTRWKDPPLLSNPSDTKTIGDRDYKLYYDGDRLRMVAWQTDQGSFWVSNSLIETLSNEDMLKIAEGFRQLQGT